MGAALGVALLLAPWMSIVIFAGLGFGLALPFLALGFIPALRRKLPKPGHWTDKLRRAMNKSRQCEISNTRRPRRATEPRLPKGRQFAHTAGGKMTK